MFLFLHGIKNIYRHRSKYIIFGIALILVSYISNTFAILMFNYQRMMGIFEFDGNYLNHYLFFTNRFSLFSVLIIAILIITVLVIIYISAVSINSMKYDLGVLLSMGIGKGKMILTVLSENGIFMFVSIIFGYLLAVVLSFFTLVYYDGQLLEVMGKLNLTVDIPVETFLFTVGGSLFFTVIPMLIQSVYILRFSPYTILQNK